LKLDHVTSDSFNILESKTEAGIRVVPIHSKLQDVVSRLRVTRPVNDTDGYLLAGLTFNKYRDRSNAIGKRFGRMKASMGFSGKQVFHSIRKTVVTLLENAGVGENVTADIVGHDKPRITYGLYSGGATPEVMREALERIAYPSPVEQSR
jgi:integrase